MIRNLNAKKTTSTDSLAENSSPTRPGKRILLTLVGAVCTGSAVGIAWINESFGWLALLGLAGFLTLHLTQSIQGEPDQRSQQRKLRWHFLLAWIHGSVSFTIATFWFPYSAGFLLGSQTLSLVIGIAIWLYLGFQYALIGLTLAAIRRRTSLAWLAVPAVWLGILWLFPNMFPFLPACLLTNYDPMLQLAEIGGVQLVSIYAISIAGFIAWSFTGCLAFYRQGVIDNFKWRCAAGLMLLGIFFWGEARAKSFERQYQLAGNTQLKVGLVQASTKYNVSHQRMIDVANSMASTVDLMIWPENSLGNYSTELTNFSNADHVSDNSKGDESSFQPWPNPGAALLAGADIWQPDDGGNGTAQARFVAALLINESQELDGRRHKIALMPFGEFIPGRDWIPKLKDVLDWLGWLDQGLPISAGSDNQPIGQVNGVSIAALLCCEDMFPSLAAAQVKAGGNLLVTIGNNVVFNSDVVGQQHFRIARFRAIENRVPMIRCMTTGVSGLISPSGRVISLLPEGEDAAGVLSVAIQPNIPTLFIRWGKYIPICLMTLGVAALVFLSRKNENRKATEGRSRLKTTEDQTSNQRFAN